MDENALYEDLKKAFTVEKGSILIVEITTTNILELVPQIFYDVDSCAKIVRPYIEQGIPHLMFDYLTEEDSTYTFRGKTFRKTELINSREVIDFAIENNKEFSEEDLRRDLARLGELLRNSKAS